MRIVFTTMPDKDNKTKEIKYGPDTIDLSDPKDINEMLTTQGDGMSNDLFGYYNGGSGSGSGSVGIGSRYNCGKGKTWDAKLNKCV